MTTLTRMMQLNTTRYVRQHNERQQNVREQTRKKSIDKAFQWQTCVKYVADQIPKIPYAFCINKLRYKQELFDFQHQRKNSSQQSYDILNSHTCYYMHTMHCHILRTAYQMYATLLQQVLAAASTQGKENLGANRKET